MSCVLRFASPDAEIRMQVASAGLVAHSEWTPETRKRQRIVESDKFAFGARVLVSEADFDQFEIQVRDAIRFLELNGSVVRQLASGVNVSAVMDFGVDVSFDTFSTFELPTQLVSLASHANVALAVSPYPSNEP